MLQLTRNGSSWLFLQVQRSLALMATTSILFSSHTYTHIQQTNISRQDRCALAEVMLPHVTRYCATTRSQHSAACGVSMLAHHGPCKRGKFKFKALVAMAELPQTVPNCLLHCLSCRPHNAVVSVFVGVWQH